MKIILTCAMFLYFLNCTFATNYFMAENGNDNNNGTSISTPWKTLQKLSAELGGPAGTYSLSINNGDRIFFRRGDTFRGYIAFSAYNNQGITFDCYGTGALPIIKGSTIVTNWTIHNGNIWKATVPQNVYFLYVNNVKQTLARTPNAGTWNISNATATSINSTSISSSGLNFVGANLCLREYDWRLNRQVITAQSGNTVSWANNINAASPNANFYFDNKLALLDTDGEWFYDLPTQTLYLMTSAEPNSFTIEASTNMDGIAGNDNRSDNTIQNLQFEHYAEYAIRLKGASNNNKILNCKFINNSNAVFLSGTGADISNNVVENAYIDGLVVANMTNSNIKLNTITNVGIEFGNQRPNFVGDFYTAGIWLIQGNSGCSISENTISNCGFNGIRYGGSGIMINKNYIENTLINMDDGGAIYTYGSDAFNNTISNNIIKKVVGDHNGTPLGGIANGIYIDNFAHHHTIQNNTIEDIAGGSAILINAGAHDNTISSNISYKCREGITFADWQSGQSIYGNSIINNTFYANLQNSIPLLIASDDNNYNVFSNSNDNYLCNPYGTSVVNYMWSSSQTFTLSQWQQANATNNFDTYSKSSFYNLTFPDDNSFIVTNNSNTSITISYQNVVDLNNSPIISITILPYTSAILINTGTLGTENRTLKQPFTIFPNPTTDFVNLILNDTNESFVDDGYYLYNSVGQVLQKNVTTPELIDLQKYKSGIYLLKIGNRFYKIIKK